MAMKLDQYRLLGRSGLRVSPLSLGTMTFGVAQGEWGSTEADASQMLGNYIDRGGNFVDTANFYGQMGGSETLLGRLLGDRRERVVLSTKYSLTTRPGDPNASGNHRRNMVRAVEDSLRRLNTDYIDLFYLHMWDATTPVDEVLRGFDDLVRSGKIVYAGISDTPAWRCSHMQGIADLRGWAPFVALQISYSLIERTVERELLPMALAMGMGVIPWSPLGGGVLSGKYTLEDLRPAAGGKMSSRKDINLATGRLTDRNLEIAMVAAEIAREIECTPAQVALAWTLLDPAVTSPVIGARTLAQFEDNMGALDVSFSDSQRDRLDTASKIELGFPHDMLAAPSNAMAFGNVKIEPRA
jgi:aryl-alcohol dehydrogenase-like predicted oxidoreductase